MFERKMESTTSMAIVGLGNIVHRFGKLVGGKIGAGIMGYGLAHIVLGKLAKVKSAMKVR